MPKGARVALKHDIHMKKASSEEARAAAETAISARQKATDAKAAAEAAGGADEALNTAQATAEQEATTAEASALALSQSLSTDNDPESKKAKLLKRRSFIDKDLKALGVDVGDEDENDDEDEEDLDKPLTRRDLQAIEAGKARTTAKEMADAITDPLDKDAVLKALALVVPSVDPAKDFQAAVAIANIERNSKILEEIGRKPITRSSPTGTGAPARREEAFVPTAAEAMFMRQMGLTKEDVLKARAASAKQS